MFLKYFGFSDEPFGVTPEPRCLYQSRTHREALASLKYGFLTNRGFTALIASPGMGKTTLLYALLNEIRGSARSVFLFDLDVQCKPKELIAYILRDLGIAPCASSVEMHEQLNGVLLEAVRQGQKLVVVIDEAQNLSDAALETVRLLSNFETSRHKLMQIVLAGQPQLAEKLMKPSLVQLRQRISTICRLQPLSHEETRSYIAHRLKVSGYEGEPLFTPRALDRICEFSHGIPRVINNVCFNALSLCRALKRKQVDDRMVGEVISDLQLVAPQAAIAATPEEAVHVDSLEEEPKRAPRNVMRWVLGTAAMLFISALGIFDFSELSGHRLVKLDRISTTRSAASSSEEPVSSAEPALNRPAEPIRITVQPHQTLQDITVQYFGAFTATHLRQIRALNPEIVDPNHIEAGQTIWIPGSTATTPATVATSTANARNLQ